MHLGVLTMIEQAQRIHKSHSKKSFRDKRYSYNNSQLLPHTTLATYTNHLAQDKAHAINNSTEWEQSSPTHQVNNFKVNTTSQQHATQDRVVQNPGFTEPEFWFEFHYSMRFSVCIVSPSVLNFE